MPSIPVEKAMTLIEAKILLNQLNAKKNWIAPMIDSNLRRSLELHIDAPPQDIHNYLQELYDKTLDTIARLEQDIERVYNHLPCIERP